MNTLSFRKVIQWTFAGVLVAAGVGFFYGAVVAAPGEPAGCANDTCKEIRYVVICDAYKPAAGYIFDQDDCIYCKYGGRCDGGNTNKCEKTDNPLKWTGADVTEICHCAKAATASAKVEGSLVKQTGEWLTSKQWTCKK